MYKKLINLENLKRVFNEDLKTYNYLNNLMKNYVSQLKILPQDWEIFEHFTPENYAETLLDIYVKTPGAELCYSNKLFDFATSAQINAFSLLCKVSLGLAKIAVNPLVVMCLSGESLNEAIAIQEPAYGKLCGLAALLNPEEHFVSSQSAVNLKAKLLKNKKLIRDIFSGNYGLDISALFDTLHAILHP